MTSAPTNAPLSVSEPKTETMINSQLMILMEQVKQFFDDGKDDFLSVGVLPRGGGGGVLPTLTLPTKEHVCIISG